MLQVSNLTRRYGSFVAVDNASFTIEKGEIVGLLGHNGAGKTTIMKMLSGYLEPDNGTIHIHGNDLSVSPNVVQQDLGYLPENLPVYPEMIVADYLDYAANLKGISGEEKQSEIKRAVIATDIAEKLLKPIYTLSRGFKQRVGVAQAILGSPKLLILDEPTNGLDPTQTEHMRQLIQEIAKDATVILSTHIMQEVDAICDRVLILNRGKLAIDAQLSELRKSNRIVVKTSLDDTQFKKLVNEMGVETLSVENTAENDGKFSFTITLGETDDTEETGAKLAQSIIGSGAQLFQLSGEKRDLESLFKEVNQTGNTEGGLSDAA